MNKEAQDLFDAIARMLPTTWNGTSIEVMDHVTINPPYRVEDCVAKEGASKTTLPQVKKVVRTIPFGTHPLRSILTNLLAGE